MSEVQAGPCRYCKMLLGQLAVVMKQHGELAEYEAWNALRSHLARKHAAEIPGYAADCTSCEEWKALTPHVRPNLLATLAAEAAKHRAGHLIVTQRPAPDALQVGLAPFRQGGETLWVAM